MARGRKPGRRSGKRISVWLPPDSLKTANQIENMSGFVQLALRQASSIMAFDMIRQAKGLREPSEPTPEQVTRFNIDHPIDPLTAKRIGKIQNGPAPQALTGNPALDN